MKGLLPKFAYGLVAILVIAGLMITLGQRESQSKPSATSYFPSGLHAFQDLLERNGISTHVDRLEQPRLKPTDLVIAAYVNRGFTVFGDSGPKPIEESLKRHLQRGGRVLVLPFDEDFRARSFTAIKQLTPVVSKDGQDKYEISSSPLDSGGLFEYQTGLSAGGARFLPIEFSDDVFMPWLKRDPKSTDGFVAIAGRGPGMLCRTADGLFATNRFMDRGDNAQFALRIVNGLLPEGGRVVFAEATVGNAVSPSLVNVLGPWATGIWMQLLVLFLVVIVTLGVRFGLPEISRRKQRGEREMVDAVSDVYRRARSTAVALDVAYRNADQRIRRALKIPTNVGAQDRDRLLPDVLVRLLQQVDAMRQPVVEVTSAGRQKVTYRLDPSQALALITKLEAALDASFPKRGNRIS